jgi:acyl carrier protein
MTSMTEAEILAALRQFIQDNFLYMKPGFVLGDDDSLLKKGVVDSMGVMEVLGFLEERFSVTPDDTEITEANLGSLRSIATFVRGKQSGSGLHS